ncbi:MAG TPA: hypothetical protein PLM53_15205 [Spirochaetota bacterium]|nr:hypothetical protein [Spirochaetota bacterium]HPC42150.1 hypothetical protein [Spirochaetota bacterium]HQF09678.1 hypothetical protein [Spirochaetota bacterium]HQH98444.1 hypothetical protein [Spirochaetota bacterium]HQJ72205.1 hypothetical protein [Spirochaetota bacterium]
MDIVTVLGITWRKASMEDLIIVFTIIMIPVSLFILLKIIQTLKNRKVHEEQLFLFRLKRLGLSNFQIRIVNNLIEMLGFPRPMQFIENPEMFEKAVGRFLTHTRGTGESEDSQLLICRDLTTIYDKIYFHMKAKKPLKGIQDVDGEQLIYFTPVAGKVFLGKIVSRNAATMQIRIFGNAADLAAVPEKQPVTFHIFRVGDAEYDFTSPVHGREGTALKVGLPEEVVKREESRHPYIDVILPALISREKNIPKEKELREIDEIIEKGEAKTKLSEDEGMIVDESAEEKLPCTIYKLNDYEAVVRLPQKLDFNYRYILDFQAMDFNFRIYVRIIATKTVEEGSTIYYTVKFDEMSPSSQGVLKKYVYEHL